MKKSENYDYMNQHHIEKKMLNQLKRGHRTKQEERFEEEEYLEDRLERPLDENKRFK